MNTPPIALRIAIPAPLRQLFTYLPPTICNINNLSIGSRIQVPFHKRQTVGILVEKTTTPDLAWDKLKPAIAVIDDDSIFTKEIWELCLWAADYYHYPLGEVLMSALPALLREGKPAIGAQEIYWQLSEEQSDITNLKRSPKLNALLQLLKGSGPLTTQEIYERGFKKNHLDQAVKKNWLEKIEKKPHAPPIEKQSYLANSNSLNLNHEQANAVTTITNAKQTFRVFLLDGITGSGKTEVYLQVIAKYLPQQILVLVPEIGLTPQTIQRFKERFSVPIIALHSRLTEKERLNAWIKAKNNEVKIIIGTRSAIFTPFANLGLIIVDEEHDLSFKQQEGFRYHARDCAVIRAQYNKIPIILGTATPALETLHNAKLERYQHLILPARAGEARLPQTELINICNLPLEEGLSPPLLNEIQIHLSAGNQVMLFLNRRGFAPVLICHTCGWIAHCKRCDARMTYHQFPERLHCHHCDAQRKKLHQCEVCKAKELFPIGLGTERLEEVLTKHFPQFSIARIDRDTTRRKGSLEQVLEKIQRQEHHILIGTQMLAKGHHFPHVTLVGIVDADGGFFSTDFRALERMGQLLLQVSGRAGRAEKSGKVVIQTHHPDHPLLHQLLFAGYPSFAVELLKERKKANLPPFFFFALFRAEAYDPAHATLFLQQVKQTTDISAHPLRILGPIPAPMTKRAGLHRMQLLIQTGERRVLQNFLKNLLPQISKIPNQHRVHWSLDVDPVEMY